MEAVRYLSEDWLRLADQELGSLSPVPSEVVVGVHVRSGPEGDKTYRLILGPDRVGLAPGDGSSGATMSLDWEDAVAIAQGRSSAQRAFLDGRLQLGGDTSVLLGHQQALADIDDRLADLRAATLYS